MYILDAVSVRVVPLISETRPQALMGLLSLHPLHAHQLFDCENIDDRLNEGDQDVTIDMLFAAAVVSFIIGIVF